MKLIVKEKTKDIGFAKTYSKIESLGASNVREFKSGNKRTIIFTAKDGKEYHITTRTKTRGTWQTSIDYGMACKEIMDEREYWVFVDVLDGSLDFYIVPLWWIKNDIHRHHCEYLERHGGQRPISDKSKHHAISKRRVAQWRGKWKCLGL